MKTRRGLIKKIPERRIDHRYKLTRQKENQQKIIHSAISLISAQTINFFSEKF